MDPDAVKVVAALIECAVIVGLLIYFIREKDAIQDED